MSADDAFSGHFHSKTDFAEELATGLYDLPGHWPYNHINWDAAADNLLQSDYMEHNDYYFNRNI